MTQEKVQPPMYSAEDLRSLLASLEAQLPAFLAGIQNIFSLSQQKTFSLQEIITLSFQEHQLSFNALNAEKTLLTSEYKGPTSPTLLLYYRYDDAAHEPTSLLPFFASLNVLTFYHELARPFPLKIRWLLDGRKAAYSGIHSIPPWLQTDYILWTKLTSQAAEKPLLALGAKGYLSCSLSTNTGSPPLPSSYGAIVSNAAWRLLWALASLKDAREEILIDGFYDPLDPASDQAIESLYALPQPILPPERGFLHQLQGFQLQYAHLLVPTCSITSFISSSGQEQVHLPEQAKALLDFYLVPAQDPDDIFHKLQQHLFVHGFADIALQRTYSTPPRQITPDHPFTKAVEQAIQQAYAKEAILLPLCAETFPFTTDVISAPLLVQSIDLLEHTKEKEKLDPQKYIYALKEYVALFEGLAGLVPSHPKFPDET